MTILVTGARGFVGRALCSRLFKTGYSVRAIVRASAADSHLSDAVIIRDIGNGADWQTALVGVKSIVHLAARVHVMHDTAVDPLAVFRAINVDGTLNLARQAAIAGVKRFVFVSSIKVNGELTRPGQKFTEADVPNPQDPYATSKHEAEVEIRQIAAVTGMEVVIIRPPLVYGPGVKANFAVLMQAVQKGWILPLGAVHNQRSLVALDNLVDFILTCLSNPAAANQTFLLSDGHDVSTTDLLRGIAEAAGVPVRLFPMPVWTLLAAGKLVGRTEAVQRLCSNLQVDIGKARDVLGWAPPILLAEGLRRTMEGAEALD